MSNVDNALRWLSQSKRDLDSARALAEKKIYESACFYSQQASEKALKSLLFKKGYISVITHSTKELLKAVKKEYPKFSNLEKECIELDKHYIPPRYPNSFPAGAPYEYYTEEDASRCVTYAESILKEVERLIRG